MSTGVNVGSIVAYMRMNTTGWNAGVIKVKKDSALLKSRMGKTFNGMANTGAMLTKKLTLPLVAVGVAGLKMAMDLNKGLAEVQTLIPGTGKRIDDLKKGLQEMSPVVGKFTSDLTGGLYEVISAFGDAPDTMEKLKVSAIAATAGMATTKDSIKLLSAVTKGYGDTSAVALGKVADLAFQTVKLGQTTYPELAASMGKVIPLAQTMNVSQEELFTTMATLTGVTGDAANVTTQLRGIFTAMTKPSEGMIQAMKDVGYTTGESMLKSEGFIGSLVKLTGTTDGTSIGLGKLFRNVRGLSGMLPLVNTLTGEYNRKLVEMGKSNGSANEAFKTVATGINATGFRLKQAGARLIIFAQKLGDMLMPVLSKLLDIVEPIISGLTSFIDNFKQLSKGTQNVVKALGLLIIAGPVVATVIGKIGLAYIGLNTALKANAVLSLKSKVGLAALGVAIAVGTTMAVMKLTKELGNLADAQEQVNKANKRSADAHDMLKSRLNAAIEKYGITNEQLKKYRASIKGSMKDKERDIKVYFMIMKAQKEYTKKKEAHIKALADEKIKVDELAAKVKKAEEDKKKAEIEAVKRSEKNKIRKAEQIEIEKEATEAMKEMSDWRMDFANTEHEKQAYQARERAKELIDRVKNSKGAGKKIVEIARALGLELQSIDDEARESKKEKEQAEIERQIEARQAKWEADVQEIAREDAQNSVKKEKLKQWYELQKAFLISHVGNDEDQKKKLLENLKGYYDEAAIKLTTHAKLEKFFNSKKMQMVGQAADAIGDIWKGLHQMKLDNMTREYTKEKAWIIANIEDHDERENALAKLDQRREEETAKVRRKIAIAEKASAMVQAGINIALAVTKAFAQGGFLGIFTGAVVAAAGAVQLALIASAPVGMREGGMTQRDGMAMLHKNEVVVPFERAEGLFNGGEGPAGGGGSVNIEHLHLSALNADGLADLAQHRLAPILQDLMRDGFLTVPQGAVSNG